MAELARVRTSVLDLAYEHGGPTDALPIVLLHGYPYDARAFDEVATFINAAGFRTIVPYLRGYGPTRFLSPDTPRHYRPRWMHEGSVGVLSLAALNSGARSGETHAMEAFMRILVSVMALAIALAWPSVGEAKSKKSTVRSAATLQQKQATRLKTAARPRAPQKQCAGYLWWGCVGWDPDPNVRATLVRDYMESP